MCEVQEVTRHWREPIIENHDPSVPPTLPTKPAPTHGSLLSEGMSPLLASESTLLCSAIARHAANTAAEAAADTATRRGRGAEAGEREGEARAPGAAEVEVACREGGM